MKLHLGTKKYVDIRPTNGEIAALRARPGVVTVGPYKGLRLCRLYGVPLKHGFIGAIFEVSGATDTHVEKLKSEVMV